MENTEKMSTNIYKYKGFFIWGNCSNYNNHGTDWIVEAPDPFNPDSDDVYLREKFYEVRDSQPLLKTLKQAKDWINTVGVKIIEK